MEYIENETHLVEVIEGKESIIGRKYKKIDIGLLWIECIQVCSGEDYFIPFKDNKGLRKATKKEIAKALAKRINR